MQKVLKGRQIKIEWAAGVAALPAYVQAEGETYRPEVLVWLNAEGLILGASFGKPGEWVDNIAESLEETAARPQIGPPHRPDRVRVGTKELQQTLQRALPDIEIVEGETPEFEDFLSGMAEHWAKLDKAEEDKLEDSYLTPDQSPAAVGGFFRAAAAFFRKAPWKIVPNDACLISVTIEELGVRDAVVTIVGQLGESLGFIVFSDLDDYEAYLSGAEMLESGKVPRMPRHWALHFDRGAKLEASVRKEIAQHGWEVASADAYPWIAITDEELMGHLPNAEDTRKAEAVMLGLTELLDEKTALQLAWSGGEVLERSFTVKTYAGALEVKFRVPSEGAAERLGQLFNPLHALFELEDTDDDELDDDVRRALEEILVRRFADAEEAAPLAKVGACHVIMEYAASHFGVTIATLEPRFLEEILFEIFPAKVSVEASEARAIIEEARAFFAFLGREFDFPRAEDCLDILGGDAVETLEQELANPRNFGSAKSLVMQARAAGIDTSSQLSLGAWLQKTQSPGFAQSAEQRPSPPSSTENRKKAQAKAAKRKMARKSKRKNR